MMNSYDLAKKYYEENGDLFVNASYKTADGYSLGDWVRQQIEKYRAGTLDSEKISMLEKIGMDWLSPFEREWENHYKSAERYFLEKGHLSVPVTYSDEDGFALGQWLWRMRKGKTKVTTNPGNGNQYERLTAIGMVWKDDTAVPKEKLKLTHDTVTTVSMVVWKTN